MATKDSTDDLKLDDERIPLLPLRDVVVFPHTVIPLFVGRKSSVNAITEAMGRKKYIFLLTQKDEKIEDPSYDDLHRVGTVATILQMLKLPDGTIKVLIEGIKRAKVKDFFDAKDYNEVQLEELNIVAEDSQEESAMTRLALESFEEYVKLNKKIPEEVFKVLQEVKDNERFTDVIIANLNLDIEEKQRLLETEKTKDRLERVLGVIQSEIELLDTEKKIQSRVRKQMESNQRDYYLNEQMKSIQKELGQLDDENEVEELKAAIEKASMPKDVKAKAENELKKLSRMSSQSSDASIIRTYIENYVMFLGRKKQKSTRI
jgi:ATP-dependent Lon protease